MDLAKQATIVDQIHDTLEEGMLSDDFSDN